MEERPHSKETLEAQSDIRKALCVGFLFVLVGIIAPVLAYNALLLPSDESAASWFRRSGSISVFAGVVAEYWLSGVKGHIELRAKLYTAEQCCLSERYKRLFRPIHYLAFIVALIGTAICGYGDFLN